MYRNARAIGLSLFGLTLVACVLGLSSGATNPRAMLLQLRDLPRGFSLHQTLRNAATSYTAVFTITAGSPNLTGLYRIESTASVYPSVAGAEAALLYYANGVKRSTPKEKAKALPSSAKLGSEARIYSLRYYNGNLDTDLYSVVWRHGTIVGVVVGEGEAATVDPKAVIALAQKEQRRINQVA